MKMQGGARMWATGAFDGGGSRDSGAAGAAPIGDVVNDIDGVVDDTEAADIELIADFEDTNKLDIKALGGCRPLPPGV